MPLDTMISHFPSVCNLHGNQFGQHSRPRQQRHYSHQAESWSLSNILTINNFQHLKISLN
jgi:hypothetical protein